MFLYRPARGLPQLACLVACVQRLCVKETTKEIKGLHPAVLTNPHLKRHALRLQLVYLDACIKETMRLHPAVVNLLRKNELPDSGLDLLGTPIPSGAHMALFIYGVHRDPAYWERVEEFLPERFLPVRGLWLGSVLAL
jgi:cytochrome P450